MRHIAEPLVGFSRRVQNLQAAVDAFEFGEAGDQPRPVGRRPARIPHRSEASHAGVSGGTGRDSLDGLGAEADFLYIYSRGQIFGHLRAPYARFTNLRIEKKLLLTG